MNLRYSVRAIVPFRSRSLSSCSFCVTNGSREYIVGKVIDDNEVEYIVGKVIDDDEVEYIVGKVIDAKFVYGHRNQIQISQ